MVYFPDYCMLKPLKTSETVMLVIHPQDRTTAMLSALYQDRDDVRLSDSPMSKAALNSLLYHTPARERILLLGHGSGKGLFWRPDDTADGFRLLLDHSHAYCLRKHGGNLLGMWCDADRFARTEGLHGLFTGMIVTEMSEAVSYGIPTSPEELARENTLLAVRLRRLLDEGVWLSDIPARIAELDNAHTPLTEFNYRNFYYY